MRSHCVLAGKDSRPRERPPGPVRAACPVSLLSAMGGVLVRLRTPVAATQSDESRLAPRGAPSGDRPHMSDQLLGILALDEVPDQPDLARLPDRSRGDIAGD